MTESRRSWNQAVVDEFRANGGAVGGMHREMTLLLLHHVGAKSGAEHVTPLTYMQYDDRWVVFGANGARPVRPGWYFNLLARPETDVEVGGETYRVLTRFAEGDEREALCARMRQESELFRRYEPETPFEIPVVVFERIERR